jgi:hypothetical protein
MFNANEWPPKACSASHFQSWGGCSQSKKPTSVSNVGTVGVKIAAHRPPVEDRQLKLRKLTLKLDQLMQAGQPLEVKPNLKKSLTT